MNDFLHGFYKRALHQGLTKNEAEVLIGQVVKSGGLMPSIAPSTTPINQTPILTNGMPKPNAMPMPSTANVTAPVKPSMTTDTMKPLKMS